MEITQAFSEFLQYQEANNAPPTVKFYRQTVGDFLWWLEQHRRTEFTPGYVDEFITDLREGWQPAERLINHRRPRGDQSLAKYRRALRAFANFSAERGYMEPIKVKVKLPPRPIPHLLTEEDVATILLACEKLRDRLVITLLVDTGLRASEALKLKWSDVDLENGRALVRKGKGGKYRTVPLSPTSVELLKSAENGSGPVIRSHSGENMT